jgi:3-deoxy-D-manno-octulosonic acid hydroxylase-like protein
VSAWIEIADYFAERWPQERALQACRNLEEGRILFFRGVPFTFPVGDREFLLSQKQAESRFHKNISYRPKNDELRGVQGHGPERDRLQQVMRDYSRNVTDFASKLLAPYAGKFQLDFASYRPLEEQGRHLPTHRRNDLLHVDSFPTRPMWGSRILRIFTNINPTEPRNWVTGAPFHVMAPEISEAAGLSDFAKRWNSPAGRALSAGVGALKSLGLPVTHRSGYDQFMLHFHDWLKFNDGFQKRTDHQALSFPPGCTWMVFTDGVPHAALSGRYALEQTLIVPRAALVAPEAAPVNVLEKLAGISLT